jgi:Cd2+/Zn2+-exporting ATPase
MALPWPALPYLSALFGSYFALAAAWCSLKSRSVDVNFLMVFAAVGAVALGHPLEAAVLLFLFSLSSTLESFAMARTKAAIEGLIKLRPDQALLLAPGGDRTVSVRELKVGDQVRVTPFSQIPSDGVVVSGEGQVDQAAMTGESEPVPKAMGDRVFAGTQNLDAMLVVSVSAAVGDTTLDKIVDLVKQAQEHKASGERISTWFGSTYTFFVLGVFALSLVIRLSLGQPGETAMYAALTLLVGLSPCALVISTPASTLSALAFAGRNGILVRGGEFIETAGQVDAVALDKTGTLTAGRFELAEICVCPRVPTGPGICVDDEACWLGSGNLSPEALAVLRQAAAAEQYGAHPIAEAIVAAARERGVDVPEATDVAAHAGLGVTARVEGTRVKIGQRRFFEKGDDRLPKDFVPHVEKMQGEGMTAVVMEVGDRFAALGLRDAPRKDAKETVENLRRLGVKKIVLLTGDTRETAEAVAKEVGIEEYHAGLLPQDKARIVQEMNESGLKVMMVGDGINDAPVLSSAAIGVAMGGLGSDVALNAADAVLMKDRLSDLLTLIGLGRRTRAIIRANLVFSTGVIVFLAFGASVFDTVFPKHFNWALPFAVVGHEGSTVLVILNGLRLLRGPRRG